MACIRRATTENSAMVVKLKKCLCSMFLLSFFGLDRAQPQWMLNSCSSNCPIEMLSFSYPDKACDPEKQKNVHGQVQFNINCNFFVIAIEVCWVS